MVGKVRKVGHLPYLPYFQYLPYLLPLSSCTALRCNQCRSCSQHLPREVHSSERAPAIDNAVSKDAIIHQAVFEDHAVRKIALRDLRSSADRDTSLEFCRGDGARRSDHRCFPDKQPMCFQIGGERSNVQPGFGEGEAVDRNPFAEKFLEDAADVIGVYFCKGEENRKRGGGEERTAGAYQTCFRLRRFLLKCGDRSRMRCPPD